MMQQQSLVARLVDKHLHSIQALRDLSSTFADEIGSMLTAHDEHVQQFLTSQKTINEARSPD